MIVEVTKEGLTFKVFDFKRCHRTYVVNFGKTFLHTSAHTYYEVEATSTWIAYQDGHHDEFALVKEVSILPGTGTQNGHIGHRHLNAALVAIAKAEGSGL